MRRRDVKLRRQLLEAWKQLRAKQFLSLSILSYCSIWLVTPTLKKWAKTDLVTKMNKIHKMRRFKKFWKRGSPRKTRTSELSFDIQFVPVSSNPWEKSDKNISWKIGHFWTFKNFLKIKGWVWGARTPIFRAYSTSSLIWVKNIFSKKNENFKSYFFAP